MRITAWNIRAGGGKRVTQIADQLHAWGTDVAVLSEFRATPPSLWLAEALAEQGLTHQRSTADPRDAASNRLLVASRWPLRPAKPRTTPQPAGRWLPVHVDAPEPIALFAMHVPNLVNGTRYQFHDAVLEIARRWRGPPAMMIGDTNTGWRGLDEETPVFAVRDDQWLDAMAGAGWADAFRRLHGDRREYTWYSPNGGNGFRLDQAFVHRWLMPRLVSVGYEWGADNDGSTRRDALSDHAALLVDLRAHGGAHGASGVVAQASRRFHEVTL